MYAKFVNVEFIGSSEAPSDVYYAEIYHNRFQHQGAVIQFRDWGMQYDSIEPGSPVIITYGFPEKNTMYGFVHHLSGDRTRNNSFMEVTFIGSSFPMKQQAQEVYKNVTGDQVVTQIANKHGFTANTIPHERVWDQLVQSGETDWEFLVKVAKKCGYSLRVDNTTISFQPMMYEYSLYRDTAPVFELKGVGQPNGWSMQSFEPIVGDSVPYEDAIKGAVAVSGMDYINDTPLTRTEKSLKMKTRKVSKPEMFDIFSTSTVIVDHETASYEAKAAEDRNSFPYRATAVVKGFSEARPDMPVFLDGIGEPYSGYWTVLEVTHCFEEKTRGAHTYTTTLVVGTDSLGDADVWTDGKRIDSPSSTKTRVINPKVVSSQKPAKITLAGNSLSVPKQVRGSFSRTENKAVPSKGITTTAPVWKSALPTVVKPDKKSTTPYHVVSRLQKKGLL